MKEGTRRKATAASKIRKVVVRDDDGNKWFVPVDERGRFVEDENAESLETHDPVERPAHYEAPRPGMSPMEIIEAYGLGFHDGNVVKYVLRQKKKNGIEDLKKAAFYLRRFIKLEEEKKS